MQPGFWAKQEESESQMSSLCLFFSPPTRFFFILLTVIIVCVGCVCECRHTCVIGHFYKENFFPSTMSLGIGPSGLHGKHFYTLKHLVGPTLLSVFLPGQWCPAKKSQEKAVPAPRGSLVVASKISSG